MRYAIRWFKCKLKPPKNKTLTFQMSNKRKCSFSFFNVWKHVFFHPGHSSYGLKEHMAWASPGHIPGHWQGLLGPVTSLGSSLNARHSPWTSGQLGKAPEPWPGWNQLEKAGEGWTRPLGLVRPGFAGKTLLHTQNTLAHSLTGTLLANPWKCSFGHFGHL